MDLQLVIFQRQYLQLFEPDFLAWPPKQLLKDADVQEWLYKNLFDSDRDHHLPPERYQLRVIKPLISRIEQAVEDPDEDEISDTLMSHLSNLISSNLPSEAVAVQQKSYVTFTCLPHAEPTSGTSLEDLNSSDKKQDPTITLLERPHLISGSRTTGFRTWEAALHLGAYLLTPAGSALVSEKIVFELGAGTGLISLLCAKFLGARHVTATDGDEAVIEALKENAFLNDLDDSNIFNASVLRWGHGLKGTWVEEECESMPYDVVVGADITYDKTSISALVGTLRLLFELRPGLQVLISGAVRNAETFEFFRQACLRSKFILESLNFQAKSVRDQASLFYATAVPLEILSITYGRSAKIG